MANPVTCKITGLDELERKLEALPAAVASRVFGEGLEKAGEIVRNSIVANAPVDSGLLSKHFGMTKKLAKKLAGYVMVGPIGQVFYPNPRRKDK